MREIEYTLSEIRLFTVQNITKKETVYTKLETGEEFPEEKEIIIKTMQVPKWFRKDGITSIEQDITANNRLARNKSVIFDKYSGRFYTISHNVDEVARKVFNHVSKTQQIGFTYDSNFHTGEPQVSELRARRDRLDIRN